jgi:hypothetical protein
MTLLVSPNQAPSSLGETSADAMIAVSDVGGSVRGFVGEDVRSAQGLDRRAVFVSARHVAVLLRTLRMNVPEEGHETKRRSLG